MLTIRLQRTGKRNSPLYRVVVAEKASSASKKFHEILGSYNPHSKDLQIKQERLTYWITQHIDMSPTIHNLFVSKKLVEGKKVLAFKLPKKAVEAAPAAVKAEVSAPEAPAIPEVPAA